MSIFSRMKRAVKAKANAAVDKAIDPEKEIDMVILELEEQRKSAYKELLAYKTSAKQMEQDIAKMNERAESFEKKAMLAVKQGDDELAKKCLAEHKNARSEVAKITRDRDEAAGYAVQLNRSRKELEAKLKMLKLKKGTMATQLAAARSGNAFGDTSNAFERLAEAERRIDDEAIEAEVHAAMNGEELSAAGEPSAEALAALPAEGSDTERELAELKARLAADASKKLGSGD